MSSPSCVAVVGASGFVGSAVVRSLEQTGIEVIRVRSPRLVGSVGAHAPSHDEVRQISRMFKNADCVINAAGVADALAVDTLTMDGANGLLPGLLARACAQRGIRLVHVSSAAVQGRLPLDSTARYAPFSPYSRSKVIGEHAALAVDAGVCVFRPPGVHAPTRDVTRSIVRVARSPLSSVAAPGGANTPQAQLINVADAITFLALHDGPLPQIVHLPSEGITTSQLMRVLGRREPTLIPRRLARVVVRTARCLGVRSGRFAGIERRLDLLWFGQEQAHSWLTDVGWAPPISKDGWHHITPLTDQEEAR